MKKKRFGFSIVGFLFLGYAAIILLGSLLLFLPAASADGAGHPYIDCAFTATSATCVTGLVPFDTALGWSTFGQIVILCLIQIGGLGFMTVITLFYLLFGKRIGIRDRDILMESQGSFSAGEIVSLVKKIAAMVFSAEAIGAAILFSRFYGRFGNGTGLYYAIFTSISAFCNAGFDVFGTGSLTAFSSDPAVLLTVSALIIIGGLGFVVLDDLFRHRFRFGKCRLHTRVVLIFNGLLILVGAALFFVLEFTDIGVKGRFADLPLADRLTNALFMAVTPRTAGFNSVDLTEVSGSGQFLTVILMFIGGNSCSTAGGVKVTTVVVVCANLVAAARGAKEVRLSTRRVPEETVRVAGAILLSYLLLVVLSVPVIGIFESAGQSEILFEVVSALATVGLTLNLTPTLGAVSKVFLIFLMYVGRLGAFTFFELLVKRKKEYISRAEGKIMVG